MPALPNPHAPWKLPVLVPLWLIQAVLALVFLITANASHSTWFIVAFSILNLLILALEVILFVKHKLPTRIYLISQWAKATLAGIVWVTIEFLTYTHWQWKYVAGFATSNFVFQHPAIIASLYYASRVYSKYGGDAGAQTTGEDTEPDEESPLLRTEDDRDV
ncbi:hypothetical protein MMC06_005480 [Schaereria dolodes]|nr:hypothetical protein [Schaereria dolodes]